MSLKDRVWISLGFEVPRKTLEQLEPVLFDHGCLGLEELAAAGDRVGVRAWFEVGDHEEARAALVAAAALAGLEDLSVSVEQVPYDDWTEGWKKHFKPTRVGRRIIIRPSWEEVEASSEEIVIIIDPGIAFGTGTHETTRLCLAALERELDARPGAGVLDVGTGSAILAIAAAGLGAQPVVGIDIDADAVESARKNLEINGVAGKIDVSTTPLENVDARFDVVVANILAAKLIPMAAALSRRVAPEGVLFLSGILAPQTDEVREAFEATGLRVDRIESVDPESGREIDRWVVIRLVGR